MTHLGSVVISTAIFAALGPLIGAIGFFGFMQIDSGADFSGLFSAGMSLVYVFLIFGAYVIGSVPAAIAGVLFGVIASRSRSGRRLYPLIGFCLGLLACAAFQFVRSLPQGVEDSASLLVPLVGGLSGSVCGAVCGFAGVGSNNSSKPTPLRGAA